MGQRAEVTHDTTQAAVIDSFDRIAGHSNGGWDHNSHYHPYLLRHLPTGRGAALDVGSGLGTFSRLLADRFDRVEAVDFSPEMVARASAHPAPRTNLRYTCHDFVSIPYPPASFDCVVCIATLHHLPLPEALAKMASLLKPGGRLLVLDLYRMATIGDWLMAAAGTAANIVRRGVGRRRPNKALRAAWAEHGRLDHYLTIAEIKSACSDLLPGARVRRHLYFRYSLIWQKAGTGTL